VRTALGLGRVWMNVLVPTRAVLGPNGWSGPAALVGGGLQERITISTKCLTRSLMKDIALQSRRTVCR
jgi:hypothetical protein